MNTPDNPSKPIKTPKPRVSKPRVAKPKAADKAASAPKKSAVSAKKTVTQASKVTKVSKASTSTLPDAKLKLRHRLIGLFIEIVGLVTAAIAAIIIVLGYSATWFSGTHFLTSLLPFAAGVLGIILITALFLIVWWWLRHWLQRHSIIWGAPVLAVGLAVLFGWITFQDQSSQARGHLRT